MKTRLTVAVGLLLCVSWAAASSRLTVLHSFGSPDYSAAYPSAALLVGSDGALYGTAGEGGAGGGGVLFRVNRDGSGFRVLKSFGIGSNDGRRPVGGLVEGADGALYGTTEKGGAYDCGTVFRVNKDGSGFAVLRSLSGWDGRLPVAKLLLASDGLLYGTASAGGDTNDAGVVFRLTTAGGDFAVLTRFGKTNGVAPEGPLLEASDGRLYGTTCFGGASNLGCVFRIERSGGNFEVIRSFTREVTSGYWPVGGLVQGADGRLYGVTCAGGSNGVGTVFSVNTDGSGFSTLVHLRAGVAARPADSLILGSDGLLYGSATVGAGSNSAVVYRADPADGSLQVLANLAVADALPWALTEAGDGYLYGVTQVGGRTGVGMLFRVAKDGLGLTTLLDFSRSGGDGTSGYAALTIGSNGRLYGVTRVGGSEGGGAVFSVQPTGQDYRLLASLGADGGGRESVGALLEGSDGWFYGTTVFGGMSNWGTIFRLSKDGVEFNQLYDVTNSSAGFAPRAGLVEHGGAIFGLMSEGADPASGGALFRFDPAALTFDALTTFAATNGANPLHSLTPLGDGYFYGTMAFWGAPTNGGTIFKTPGGTGYANLVTFSPGDTRGANPCSPLLAGPDGFLYGTAYGGGTTNNYGTVFRVKPDGQQFQVLHIFGQFSTDGRHPCGRLAFGSDGAIYGTTERGGQRDMGTLYRVNPDGSGYAILASFDATTGKWPRGGVIATADGSLYGTTDQGGEMDLGTVFRYGTPYAVILTACLQNGKVVLDCLGVSGLTNHVERATDPIAAGGWQTLLSTNPPANGRFQFSDSPLSGTQAFYRLRY